MKVKVWNDFKEFRDNVEPLEFEDVQNVLESAIGGVLLEFAGNNLCLPSTVVIDIITGEDE